MAQLVECDSCRVVTYSLKPGVACDHCAAGFMQPADDPIPDYRGDVDGVAPIPASALVNEPEKPVLMEVDIEAQPRKGPKVTGHDGADLWDLLRDGAFHKAKDLAMEPRKIRAVCAVYPNQFLSTQQGYKIVKKASDSEIENAIADLRSRMAHLNRRASALESVLRDRSQPGLDV